MTRSMLADDLISELMAHPDLKAALEELASHPLTEIGSPTVAQTAVASLDGGDKRIRISIQMVDADDSFDGDDD